MQCVQWYTCKYMTVVIIGLGNPGSKYEHSRHNAGRMAVEKFATLEKCGDFLYKKKINALMTSCIIKGTSIKIILPETMMNNSGKSASVLIRSKNAAKKLIVVHDDIDLPIGNIKMVFNHGSGGHKGVESIMRAIKTKEFTQIKIGISPSTPKGKIRKPIGEDNVIRHVLGTFSPKEQVQLRSALKRAVEAMQIFISDGIEKAIQIAHTK